MDLAKLIEQRDKLMADVTARLEAGGAGAGAAPPSVDVQQVQADRVEERIKGLEQRKADLVASIDAELKELKGELAMRTRKLAADRKAFEEVAKEAAAAPKGKEAAVAAAKDTPAAGDPKDKKAARGASAKDVKPD